MTEETITTEQQQDPIFEQVFIGHINVTPAVVLAARGGGRRDDIKEKLREIVEATEEVAEDERETFLDSLLKIYRDFSLWIPEVAQYRLMHKFVTTCPVCSLDLTSTVENNLMLVSKFTSGPLEGKARFLSCLVCDLVITPLRIVEYVPAQSKKALKKQLKKGEGVELHGVAVQGFEPCGVLIPDLGDAGIIVRTLPPDRVALLPQMWKSAAGIPEAYIERVKAMVYYWDQQDGLQKPKPSPKLYGADGSTLH